LSLVAIVFSCAMLCFIDFLKSKSYWYISVTISNTSCFVL
jgi:hypothetical protein